ncbi:MAG: peptidoglycan-binding protein, partial [Candidatus Pacebacteria bacterium]|nr:peptidoglycan-binding protein [Candidatus Paceibacterota bacterium]
ASLPPVPTTTAPATTSDVESAVSSVNADLNAVDKNAPDQNGLNDASVGTGTAAAGATTGTSSN